MAARCQCGPLACSTYAVADDRPLLPVTVSMVSERLLELHVDPREPVSAIKLQIASRTGIPLEAQRLFHGLVQLHSSNTLEAVALLPRPEGSPLELLLVKRSTEQQLWLRDLGQVPKGQVLRWLHHAPEEAQEDREVWLHAVERMPDALEDASEQLKADVEVVLAALREDGQALRFAAKELRGHREVMLTAVTTCGYLLKVAPPELRADREVVQAAVGSWGEALGYASEELRGDRQLVLKAVSRTGPALRFASKELRADREVVLEAVRHVEGALRYASEALQCDREVIQTIARR